MSTIGNGAKNFSEQQLYKDEKFKLILCCGLDGRVSFQFHVKFKDSSVFAGVSAEKALQISNLIYDNVPEDLKEKEESA